LHAVCRRTNWKGHPVDAVPKHMPEGVDVNVFRSVGASNVAVIKVSLRAWPQMPVAKASGSPGSDDVRAQGVEQRCQRCGTRNHPQSKETRQMSDKQLILAFFADQPAAETAALG
jgi:hypothetical protein